MEGLVFTATIDKWKIDYSFVSNKYFISGNIYKDSKMRYKDGEWIRSSRLIEINFEDGYAKTKNSIYKLGAMAC